MFRFDTELSKCQEEAKTERSMKEKLQRERDTLAADKYSLEKQVEVKKTTIHILWVFLVSIHCM